MPLARWHNLRMNISRRELFGATDQWDVQELVAMPSDLADGVYKCRVLYDTEIRSVEFLPYVRRNVRSLRLVDVPQDFDYAYKYADRSTIEQLYRHRDKCDDILIVRDGLITDTSFSNIALYDGREWFTPARPLLRGVRVMQLLEQGGVQEADIRAGDLVCFQKALLLNAMLGFEENAEVGIIQ